MSINNNSKAIIMKMSPLEVTRLIIYIILYPIVTLFRWLLLALTPIMHLLQLLLSGFRIPLRILASLEPVWIYLGTAVVVGVIAGSILYLMSSTLINLFHLYSGPEDQREPMHQPADSKAQRSQVRGRRPLSSRASADMARSRLGTRLINPYPDYVDPDQPRPWPRGGLLAQTILEEDDSDELF